MAAAVEAGFDPEHELQVGLCGRSARVPLRPGEGIGELRSRVAGTFGLKAPFGLKGPDGKHLHTDEDAARASQSQSSTMRRHSGAMSDPRVAPVCVDASEEALLDLERAHNESGALRWELLRKVIAELRREIADAVASTADAHRRSATLEERLVHEASDRKVGDDTLCQSFQAHMLDLDGAIARVRHDAKEELASVVNGAKEQLESDTAKQVACLREEISALRQGLAGEETARHRAGDEMLRCLEDLRLQIRHEGEQRAEAIGKASMDTVSLDSRCKAVRQQFSDMEARALEEASSLEAKISQELARLDANMANQVAAANSSIETLRNALEAQVSESRRGAGQAADGMLAQMHETEAALARHAAATEERLTQFAGLEAMLRGLVDKESAIREEEAALQKQVVKDLTDQLQQERIERCKAEDRIAAADATTASATASILDTVQQERQARQAMATEHMRALDELAKQLQTEERNRSTDDAALNEKMGQLREALSGERRARESTCEALAAAAATRSEDVAATQARLHAAQAEQSREWARLLVERLNTDLKKDQETASAEIRRQCEDIAATTAGRVRAEFVAEVRRLDATAVEQSKAQVAARNEERTRYENRSKAAADEIKAALAAQSEFAEALEKEQRLLVERLNGSFSKESEKYSDLDRRVVVLEGDMKKVRGHLPLIFASFR